MKTPAVPQSPFPFPEPVRRAPEPRLSAALLLGCAAALCWGSVAAQGSAAGAAPAAAKPAAAARPAPAPAAAPKPGAAAAKAAPAAAAAAPALSGGKKIMTREELRVCLQRNDDLKARSKEIDERALVINAERPTIESELDEVRAGRTTVEARAAEVKAFEPRILEYRKKVESFNARMTELSGRERLTRSEGRELEDLRKQSPALEEERKALNADRDRLVGGYEEALRAFAARAKAAEDRANDWNQRKARHSQDGQDVATAAADWQRECGDRPYREDDEKAIRAGK